MAVSTHVRFPDGFNFTPLDTPVSRELLVRRTTFNLLYLARPNSTCKSLTTRRCAVDSTDVDYVTALIGPR